MNYIEAITNYTPQNEQEATDRGTVLDFITQNPGTALHRRNHVGHLTASAFILNPGLDKALLIHHNLMNHWAWTGGHADGEQDLLAVALREAGEETGAVGIRPLSRDIASVDVLTVQAHHRHGVFVGAHLHLSVAYLLLCDEDSPLQSCPEENSGVAWFGLDYFTQQNFTKEDVYLYQKLIARARALGAGAGS